MTDRLLSQMIKFNIIEKEDEEIYRFGLEGLMLKLVHYTTYLFIAIFLGEVLAFLFFFVSFLLLRKNAGGYHAETKKSCYISSCLTIFGIVVFMKFLRDWSIAGIILAVFTIIADIVIYKLAPLGNKNRELDEEEVMYFKRRTRVFLVVENIVFIVFAIAEKENSVVTISIAMAIICEAVLLLLEKIRKGNDETGVKQGSDLPDS